MTSCCFLANLLSLNKVVTYCQTSNRNPAYEYDEFQYEEFSLKISFFRFIFIVELRTIPQLHDTIRCYNDNELYKHHIVTDYFDKSCTFLK